jgi:2-phospho-L-lactate guanylyltransferase (CobY/MobA/RfbA family)
MTAILTEATRDLTTRLSEALGQQKKEKLARRMLRNLVRAEDALVTITLSAWNSVCEAVEAEGFEARELAAQCKVLLDGINLSLGAYEKFLEIAEASEISPKEAGLEEVKARLPLLKEVQPKIASLLEFATRPPKPLDEARLNKAREDFECGRFVTLNDATIKGF